LTDATGTIPSVTAPTTPADEPVETSAWPDPAPRSHRYPPIEEHGVIGDLHTVALVAVDGTIDWYCIPHFDSPSVFASILDADKGGEFRIAPVSAECSHKQLYLPDTNVLITRALSPDGVSEVQDFMPIERGHEARARHRLIRRVLCVRGNVRLALLCEPAFDYARVTHETSLSEHGAVFASDGLTLSLSSPVPLRRTATGVCAEFELSAGQTATFILERMRERRQRPAMAGDEAETAFTETVEYWRNWIGRSQYKGRWREIVQRSALVLKLLTFSPTGAIVAAPTTSLPEIIGGGRNWDYRYTWIRDAAFSLFALLRLGFSEEAGAFMSWLEARARSHERDPGPEGPLQIMYGIDGRSEIPELELDHLSGYRGSRPVRIGNAASRQLQLDIYGELLDSVYLYNKYGSPISWDLWMELRRLVDWLGENWQRADEGIWEVRGGRQQFVYSKLMSWVAFERAIRIGRFRGLPYDAAGWGAARDRIYENIMEHGWSEERRAFVQYYGSRSLDASNLLMPLVKFVGPTDPRMLSTLEATQAELVRDSLVYRYDQDVAASDGLAGREGTFSMCSFWYVECLARAGRTDEARLVFEKMLTYANHLRLYSEEIGPSGELLGNFPQAFTHLALISAAFTLDRALSR
jgi:GH15 family glucan-1,4-alpha-glucosidase